MAISISISNINIKKIPNYDEKKLNPLLQIINTYDKNAINLLPTSDRQQASFIINSTHSKFANAIRRVLVEELPVYCMAFDYVELNTDDDFILCDLLQKNINLIPIQQENKYDKIDDVNLENKLDKADISNAVENIKIKSDDNSYKLTLHITNKTDNIIDITASQLNAFYGKKLIPITDIIPDPNIILTRLRPTKTININKIIIICGMSKNNYAKFSLLDNVIYRPLDVEPYNQFTKKGTRSIETTCKKFYIEFTTTGNITAKHTMLLLKETLLERLLNIQKLIKDYIKTGDEYYYNDLIEIKVQDGLYTYKLFTEYITIPYMLAQRCFILDPNVLFCTATIDRYDNEIGIIKIKHANSNKLLLDACAECMSDIDKLYHSFNETKITQ